MSQTPTTGNYPPVAPRTQRSGVGCWVTFFMTAFIVMVLVIVGLFLPPISLYDRLFGETYTMLDAQNNGERSADQAFAFAIAPEDTGSKFGVQLETVSLVEFESGNTTAGSWVTQAKNAVPVHLALQSDVYSIDTTGEAPHSVTITLTIPENTAKPQLLDLYGWHNETNEWRFLPSEVENNQLIATVESIPDEVAIFQASPPVPTVVVSYDLTQVLSDRVGQVATIVTPAGLQPTTNGGGLVGALAPGFNPSAGYLLMPAVRNYSTPRAIDPETVIDIISNSTLRDEHVRKITETVSLGGYDGIWIDYRALPDDELTRESFNAFITALHNSLGNIGKRLGVVVPSAENVGGFWQTGAYDWRVLGQNTDYLQINLGINPGLYLPGENQFVEAMLRWTVREVDRSKVLIGLSAQSIRENNGTFTSIGYDQALAGLGNVKTEAQNVSETGSVEPGSEIRISRDGMKADQGIDPLIDAPYLDYLNDAGEVTTRVWLTTGNALRYRMDRTIPFALTGVAFEDLLEDDLADNVLDAIINYKTEIPSAPAPSDLALRWQIVGSEGVLENITTGINEDVVVTLTAPDGKYAVNMSVVGIGEQVDSQRAGATVALFRPTATPTPIPTAVPTSTPTATPTLAPIIPTTAPINTDNASVPGGSNNAPSGGGFGANLPSPGSINAGFEYGGHVTGAGSAAAVAAMKRAGMTWMKVQIRYYPNISPDVAAGEIAAAHANGFKILIGTVGSPADLASGGDGYKNSYAKWVGGIAALGADAIEVWNEPNLGREWPSGQISGAAYTDMLRRAYENIKANSPGTIVISGALAPTGAEAAYPGEVVNDNRFLGDMVSSGALNYMDCLGAHYNEGIVPPSVNSGDPRDNYYTRYFGTMLNTYKGIIGNQKPICFTELGYLTSEGYPPLPEFFSWAQNVTLAQQSAWLAQAISIASQAGNVRLLIVWNVDFTLYTTDPQAGYAMIRADGSCPACDAISAAR